MRPGGRPGQRCAHSSRLFGVAGDHYVFDRRSNIIEAKGDPLVCAHTTKWPRMRGSSSDGLRASSGPRYCGALFANGRCGQAANQFVQRAGRVHVSRRRKNRAPQGRPIRGCRREGAPAGVSRYWRGWEAADPRRDSFQKAVRGASGFEAPLSAFRRRTPDDTQLVYPYADTGSASARQGLRPHQGRGLWPAGPADKAERRARDGAQSARMSTPQPQ